MNLFELVDLLADRPQCEHNLNGPCKQCGRGLTVEETVRWQHELSRLVTDGGFGRPAADR